LRLNVGSVMFSVAKVKVREIGRLRFFG